jgi:L-cysteine desulfidase
MSNGIFFSNNTQPAMTLSANGNLGIGTTSPSGTITLNDGIDSATLTAAMIRSLQELKGFLDYAESCDSEVGTLWRAYKIANKLEN